MKRDMDLVRIILMALENHPEEVMSDEELDSALRQLPEMEGKSFALVEHLILLEEHKLITANTVHHYGEGPSIYNIRMTWQGHDFLADAKNEQVWKKARALGDMSLEALRQVLVKLTVEILGR